MKLKDYFKNIIFYRDGDLNKYYLIDINNNTFIYKSFLVDPSTFEYVCIFQNIKDKTILKIKNEIFDEEAIEALEYKLVSRWQYRLNLI